MTEKHSVGWTRDGAEIALNGLEDYIDQTRQALEDAFKQVEELKSDKASLEQRVERLEFNYDTCRNVYEQEQEARLALEQRVEELETEGCGQCEACEDFFPLSLLNITDDGVALCANDWDEVLQATADLASQEEAQSDYR